MYSIDEVVRILADKGVAVEQRGKIKKNGDEYRPERVIKGVAGFNIPKQGDYCQIRVNDFVYAKIKNDSRLNIDNSINFPLEAFADQDGKLTRYKIMSSEMRKQFDVAYSKVLYLKNAKNYKENFLELTKNRTVYCIDHGGVEKSNISKGKYNLVIIFSSMDVDVAIEHIAAFTNVH